MSKSIWILAMSATSLPALATQPVEEVVVTGSRTTEQISEVPASVSILNSDTLQQQLKSSPELQKMLSMKVPGLGPTTGSTSNSGLTLRGRNALVLIDGVPQSTPLRNGSLGVRSIDASALQRVEVVKGATSIYGSGASGGVINYITKAADPYETLTGDLGASSRFSMVDYDNSLGKRVDGTLSGTLDRFSYVINGVYDSRGQQKDAEGDTQGLVYGLSDLDTTNLFTKLGYSLDAGQRLQLVYNLYDSEQNTDLIDVSGNPQTGVKTRAVENNTGVPRPGEPQGPDNNTNLMLKYEADQIFANTSLTADAYRQKIENVFFFSTNLANPDEGYSGGQSVIRSEKEGLRIALNSYFGWDHLQASLLYGIDAMNDLTSQPLIDGRIWVPEMDLQSRALYLQSKWTWNEDIIFKAGVRRETSEVSVDDYQTLRLCRSENQCSTPMDVKGGTLNYASTTWNLGLRYAAHSAFNPFVSYSEGFEIPDLGRLLRSATVDDMARIRTEPSIVKHYEAGFSSQLGMLTLDIAAFQSESELGTGTQMDPATGIFLPVRQPQEMTGFEIAMDYYVDETLNLIASYSHLEGKNPDTGEPLTARQVSPDTLTVAADWQPTINTRVNLAYQRVGSRDKFSPDENGEYAIQEAPVESYQLVDLTASYQLQDWEVYGGIENLLNEDYFPANAQSIAIASYYSKGLGRTATLGMKYNF